MQEINMVVNCHIKNARASRPGIFSRAPTATVTQHQMPHHQQEQQHQGQTSPPPCQAFRIFSTSHFNIMNLKPSTLYKILVHYDANDLCLVQAYSPLEVHPK